MCIRDRAEVEGGNIRSAVLTMLADPRNVPALERVQVFPHYNARMRTTCVATRLNAGHADNALPQTAEALVNCRILPKHDPNEVLATLRRITGSAVEITPVAPRMPSPRSPLCAEVLGPLKESS